MNLFTATLDGHARALDLLAQRQKVLAGNIANADTPGFKARDFDFAQALAEARGAGSGGAMAASQAAHLQASGAAAALPSAAGWGGGLSPARAKLATATQAINNKSRTPLPRAATVSPEDSRRAASRGAAAARPPGTSLSRCRNRR